MNKLNNFEKLCVALCISSLLAILFSCNTVKTVKGGKTTITITDTVRVSIVDTTKSVIETLDFQNKIVEKYDTVYNHKDSLLIVLKERTIYEKGKKQSASVSNGKSYDSTAARVEYKEVIKWKEKESKRFPVWAFFLIGIMVLLVILILIK